MVVKSGKERVIELADGTRTSKQIAEATGLAMNTVLQYCKQLDLPLLYVEVWTGGKAADLARLWGDGLSITKIGLHLGISRNAVVGKARRMGLPGRGSPIKPGGAKPGRKQKPIPPTPSERATGHTGPGIPLAERKMTSECGWIIGEPRDFRCCGAATWQGTSFCEFHAHKVFRQPHDIPKGLRLPGEKKRRAGR